MMPIGDPQTRERGNLGTDVVLYPPFWRVVAAALTVVARGSLLLTLAVVLFSDNPPTNPLKQLRLFCCLFAAPQAAAWCLARAFAARASVEGRSLVLTQRDQRIEVSLEAIAGFDPWWLPLPRAGLWLRLRSGRRLAYALAVADPVGFVEALVAAGAPAAMRTGLDSPAVVFARARLANSPGRLDHPVLKFVLFPLIPTVPIFRLHQYITYGGTFGEYYTFGLQAYLLGFGLWWVSWSLNLLLCATAARAVVEAVAVATAVAVPSYAVGVRRSLEVTQRLFYYLAIPTWLALRLLA